MCKLPTLGYHIDFSNNVVKGMNSFNKNFSYKKRNVDFITQNSNNDNKVSATESSSSTSSSMTAAATPALPTGSTNVSNQSNLVSGTKPKSHFYDDNLEFQLM